MIHPALPPPTSAKRKIQFEFKREKWRQKERRAKLNLAFHLSFPPRCCLPTTSRQRKMFRMSSFFPSSAQLRIPERGRGGGGRGEGAVRINAMQMCLSPRAWIKDFFQAPCVSSRLKLCLHRNATWQSGQGCSFAVLFMSNPSLCTLMLSLTDVFSAARTLKTHGRLKAPWSPWVMPLGSHRSQ